MLRERLDIMSRPNTMGATMDETKRRLAAAWGPLLRKWRKESGKTQTDVALAVGVAQPTVSVWERGKDYPPNSAQLVRYLNAIGKDYGEAMVELAAAEPKDAA